MSGVGQGGEEAVELPEAFDPLPSSPKLLIYTRFVEVSCLLQC